MQIETFRRILFLDLQPAIIEKMSLVKIKSLLHDLDEVAYKHQPVFVVEHERIVNARHEYFECLINNASTEFLNDFREELYLAQSDPEKKYLIKKASKLIESYMQDCFMWSLQPNNSISESMVIPALKNHLVRLYLEISAENNVKISEQFIDEVYDQFLFEHAPNPSMIHEAPMLVKPDPKKPVHHSNAGFQIHYGDFRPEEKGILSFDTIIKNQERFAQFEKQLYAYEFIDENYNFIHKHGFKTELALKYHEMIHKGCFMPRDFKRLKDIQARDIRKFLDHRYQVNLDKQFRVLNYS